MRRQIEVTVPIQVEASLTFYVDDASEVTPELIAAELSEAQHNLDRQTNNGSGVYWCGAQPFGEPMFYDPNTEVSA